jgi:formylglycine-generating enzyme required for sulfatase activity
MVFISATLCLWFSLVHQGCDDAKGDTPSKVLDMIAIKGGTFDMGSAEGLYNEQPVHPVTVPDFRMMRKEVSVEQFEVCVNGGGCIQTHWLTKGDDEACNFGYPDRQAHPMNCIDWPGARQFCRWSGARLPSEAEWEFAARSSGKALDYPWGNEEATCRLAVMDDDGPGCGESRTWPACGKPSGNTADGLCDMAGNVAEWIEDRYHEDYADAPRNGSAWTEGTEEDRVRRGGTWVDERASALRAWNRTRSTPTDRDPEAGFRCALDDR